MARAELEAAIYETEKGLKECMKLLKQKEIALNHARDELEERRVEWELHDKNMRYIKREADLVKIDEFAGVRELLRTSRDAFAEAKLKVHKLNAWVATYSKQVDDALKELARAKKVLAGYGTIIQFPGKTT